MRVLCVCLYVCLCVCDVGSWKSRGLQNKQAACLRLPCDVTTGQTRDDGRRKRKREREEREKRHAHQVNRRGNERRAKSERGGEQEEKSDEHERSILSFSVIH